ncbi:MAG: hypothetical protein R2681_01375 [Pyrinomonadaceae bacterium]
MKDLTCRSNRHPVFSADGQQIAFSPTLRVNDLSAIAILDLVTKKTRIVETPFQRIREIAFHPTDKSLYVLAYKLGGTHQIWNISYPDGNVTRVTSDGDAYRSLSLSADGTKISANRLQMHSHLWVLPKGDISRQRQLTFGENEISGLNSLQFDPENNLLFTTRRNGSEGTWITDVEGKNQRKFGKDKNVGGQPEYAFAAKRNKLFFRDYDEIWAVNSDGSDARKVDLGPAKSYQQPAVSPDEKWLYYTERDKDQALIWRRSLETNVKEIVLVPQDYSPEHFLSVSPDGKYLAFLYESKNTKGSEETASERIRRFGFLNLDSKSHKIIELHASGPMIRWTNGGKSFDYTVFTNKGSAIFRKNIDKYTEAELILEIKDDVIFNFDWSENGEDLAIGRGKAVTNVVVLAPAE